MSIKYTFLLVGLMALCSEFAWSAEKSALMLTADEEEARCELMYSLNRTGSLNCALYDECNINKLAFLDRDIAMIQKHAEKALVNKKNAEAFLHLRMTPSLLRRVGLGSAIASVGTFIATWIGYPLAYENNRKMAYENSWQLFNRQVISMSDKLPNSNCSMSLTKRQREENWLFRNPLAIVAYGATVTIVLGVSAVAALVKSYCDRSANVAFVQDILDQLDQAQAIVVKLKAIRQEIIGRSS